MKFPFLKKKKVKCSAVILAAGDSNRMGTDKTELIINGKSVLFYSINAFQNCDCIDEIVIVTKQSKIEKIADMCAENGFSKVSNVILGGNTRAESSLAGVSSVKKHADYIAIHDAARPVIDKFFIQKLVDSAVENRAVVPVINIDDTVKRVDGNKIIETVERSSLVRVQTPQIFDADIIKGALTNAVRNNIAITDDASAVEAMGIKVFTVEGNKQNIKLTTQDDVPIVRQILKERSAL